MNIQWHVKQTRFYYKNFHPLTYWQQILGGTLRHFFLTYFNLIIDQFLLKQQVSRPSRRAFLSLSLSFSLIYFIEIIRFISLICLGI